MSSESITGCRGIRVDAEIEIISNGLIAGSESKKEYHEDFHRFITNSLFDQIRLLDNEAEEGNNYTISIRILPVKPESTRYDPSPEKTCDE